MSDNLVRRNSLELLVPGAFSSTTTEKVVEISIQSIKSNPFQVRKEFPEETIRELADSIQKNGLIQPILVRPVDASPTVGLDADYELIAGERRLRAYQILAKETIPAIVRKVSDSQMRLLAMVENLQRADLSITDKAEGFVSLMKELNLKVEDTASILGISRSLGFLYARIGRADPVYKQLIEKNDLDLRASDLLISLVEQVEKRGSKELTESFEKVLECPIDKRSLDSFRIKYFEHSDTPSQSQISSTPPLKRDLTSKKKQTFWQSVKGLEEQMSPTVGLTLSAEQKRGFIKQAENFFKRLGAKKFDVKF